MQLSKGKISMRQALIFVFISITSPLLRVLPSYSSISKEASWIVPIISLVFLSIYILVLNTITKKYKDKVGKPQKPFIDEIYSNIVRYSGATEATVSINKVGNTLKLQFKDNGKQYNPLKAEDPDITASAEDRKIGGLGIFMVKKMLDNVAYEYDDNINILTLTKNLD